MISQLKGIVDSITGTVITIDVQGVGYEVYCSQSCLLNLHIGQPAVIIIYTEVKEDSLRLYGFEDQLEKQVFLLLMQVKGIGPKSSADIISKVNKRELLRLIGSADSTKLQQVKGVGKKTAERIVVELKDKVGGYVIDQHTTSGLKVEIEVVDPFQEATQAMQALGFSLKDAEKAVQSVKANSDLARPESGEIVREALRFV